jgi:hypothetical protein
MRDFFEQALKFVELLRDSEAFAGRPTPQVVGSANENRPTASSTARPAVKHHQRWTV